MLPQALTDSCHILKCTRCHYSHLHSTNNLAQLIKYRMGDMVHVLLTCLLPAAWLLLPQALADRGHISVEHVASKKQLEEMARAGPLVSGQGWVHLSQLKTVKHRLHVWLLLAMCVQEAMQMLWCL